MPLPMAPLKMDGNGFLIVTVPYNETILKMKFNDWANGSNLIAATDNIRFYSAQSVNASDADHAIIITQASTYSQAMNIIPDSSSDLDFTKAGRQIQITIEARVPEGSAGGSYSTSYGIKTEADPNVSNPASDSMQSSIAVTAGQMPSNLTLSESDTDSVMKINIKANNSKMILSRVKIGFNVNPLNYFKDISLFDGNTRVAKINIDSGNVSGDANNYTVTLGDLIDTTIAEDTTKTLTIYLSVKDFLGWDFDLPTAIKIFVPADGVRASDRQGNDHYGPDSSTIITNNVTINRLSSENVTLTVSLDANTPKARNIIADSGHRISHKISSATLLTFDVKATKGNILMDTLTAQFTPGAGGANNYAIPTTAYLCDDSGMPIGTGTPASTGSDAGKVTFNDLNYTISRDTTKTFTIRIDDTLATPDTTTHISADDGQIYTVAIPVGGISGEKYNGTSIQSTGSATSYDAYAYAQGPIFTIASISATPTQKTDANTSSTLSATFNIQVQAVSGDVYIPSAAANTATSTGAFVVSYGKNSERQNTVSSVTYVQPSGTTKVTVSGSGDYYKIGEGTTAIFAVGATYTTGTGNGQFYDLRMDKIVWRHTADGANQVSDYMLGDSDWISQQIALQ